MNNKLKILLIFFGLATISFKVVPPQPGNYYYLMLKKQIILTALQNTAFDKFAFRTKTYDNVNYLLEGVAISTNEDVISPPFDLTIYTGMSAVSLKNHFRGILILDRKMMDDNGIDGSFDLYFNPKQFIAKDGRSKFFIMYILDDKANKSHPRFPPTGVKLNPSPPRNP